MKKDAHLIDSAGESKSMRHLFSIAAVVALGLYLPACDCRGQDTDPLFSNAFETGLIGFGPTLGFVPVGAGDRPTLDAPLHVTLSAPALIPTFVPVISSDPSVLTVTDGGVVVPIGQTMAAVRVTGVSPSDAPVTLWATLGNTIGAAALVYIAPGPCLDGDSSDLFGYTRQCSGNATNYHGTALWDDTYASLFLGDWPGSATQIGRPFTVKMNAIQYASFKIVTGTTEAGVNIHPNNSFGYTGLASISTEAQGPGIFANGVCYGSDLSVSTKAGTLAQCKLSLNSTYYLNFSLAEYFIPNYTTCALSACTTGWTMDKFTN
ncbi:MAG TPA: hypothetical protein VGH81_05840 [Rudaea sp.]